MVNDQNQKHHKYFSAAAEHSSCMFQLQSLA